MSEPKLKPPVEGMTVVPYGFPIMVHAWIAFVMHSASDMECIAEYHRVTGKCIDSLTKRSAIDAMIDRSTGSERKMICEFLDWLTVHYWGVEE